MSSRRPSAAIGAGLPASFPSASIRTVQAAQSTATLASGTASGPGLISPLTVFPSQLITIVTCVRWVAVEPQSPAHVPLSGWPSWAFPPSAYQNHRPVLDLAGRPVLEWPCPARRSAQRKGGLARRSALRGGGSLKVNPKC